MNAQSRLFLSGRRGACALLSRTVRADLPHTAQRALETVERLGFLFSLDNQIKITLEHAVESPGPPSAHAVSHQG